jgi:dihydroflavonol-4-reductase
MDDKMAESTPDAAGQTVLVTGGSGFVGSWVIIELLRRGYQVRTTVRQISRENSVRAVLAAHEASATAERLSFHEADLLKDAGWKEAADGADYVMHVASPMPIGEYRGQNVITPARDGTRRVLEAAHVGGARRVVITSSAAAAIPQDRDSVADENVWSELPDESIYNYPRSKTLAEQDAWRFAETNGMELSTVLPGAILGPVLSSDYTPSVEVVALMLRGKMPAVPRYGFNTVDIRNLTELHLLAMTHPKAAGERFLAAGEFFWLSQMAQILRAELGAAARRTPRVTLPDWIVRFGARFNPELAQMAPSLGVRSQISTRKAQDLLGWQTRPAKESLIDTARSLIENHLT